MFNKIKKFISDEEKKVGSFFNGRSWVQNVNNDLEKVLNTGGTILQRFKDLINNKDVDNILAKLTNGMAQPDIDKVSAVLDKAITDINIGSTIEKQIKEAPTVEDKLKILAALLQQYGPERQTMFFNHFYTLITSALNNNQMPQELYSFYTSIQQAMATPAAAPAAIPAAK